MLLLRLDVKLECLSVPIKFDVLLANDNENPHHDIVRLQAILRQLLRGTS